MAGNIFSSLLPIAATALLGPGGLGLTGAGLGGTIASGSLGGALSSALSGGNILTGALTGGASSGLSSALGLSGGGGGLFDAADGSGSFGDIISGNAANAGTYTGTGLLDSAARGLGDLTSGLGLGGGGGSSAFGGTGVKLGDILGSINSYTAQDDIAKQQKRALEQAQGYINPYAQSGQAANEQLQALLGTGGDSQAALQALMDNPGYQFRLQQGQQGIDRNLQAQGLGSSGAAIKAANDYAQSSAQQEYQNAIQNLMQQSGQGLQAGNALGNYANAIGQVGAAKTGQQSNIINQGLNSIFGGNSTEQLLSQLMRSQYGLA